MERLQEMFADVGAAVPEIWLPAPKVDDSKFAVIACDQFSAEPAYWETVKNEVGATPSSLHMMLPEAFLPQTTDKTDQIHHTMEKYLLDGTLQSIGESLVYLHRKTSAGIRYGLVMALDLEQYDYHKGAKSLIRATEGTVEERLPARIEIRRGAALEMPHIMVLIDDRKNRLMGMLEEELPKLPLLYDFELQQGGGHLTGWAVAKEAELTRVAKVLAELKEEAEDGLLFALGDGNHSFAAAKAYWEELKPTLSAQEQKHHPARYALAEVVNLYDEGLSFEPIHRLLLHVNPQKVAQEIGFDPKYPLPLQEMQPLLDAWLANHPQAELEYIHGAEECRALANAAPDRLSITWPEFRRDTLFHDTIAHGALCRKSFSMGAARDKRYYLECRKLIPEE